MRYQLITVTAILINDSDIYDGYDNENENNRNGDKEFVSMT